MELQWHTQILHIQHCEMESIDDILAYLHISKKTRYQYYQERRISVNHQPLSANKNIQSNDQIAIHTFVEDVEDICHPCFDALDVLYEDALFLIVNKPSGMLVHSDGVRKEHTLYDYVKGYYLMQNEHCPIRAIHRLDYETSGAVIFCKIPFLQPLLDHLLKEKKIDRRYRALCQGRIHKKRQCVDAPIGRDRHHSSRMRISSTGKAAKTDIYVLKTYADYTYVECHLHQGRTHQIRVHLSSIQHPILHDTLYGNDDKRIQRMALHAYQIRFFHPLQQKEIQIECPLPDDIKSLL